MKLFYLFYLSVLVYSASVRGMPKKVSLTPLSSEEEFGAVSGATLQKIAAIQEPYSIYAIQPTSSDDHQRPLRYLRTYDLPYSTQRFLPKLLAQCANGIKSQANLFCRRFYDNASNLYYTVSLEQELPSDSSRIKKNFDEIDKTSASFSTLNQLI